MKLKRFNKSFDVLLNDSLNNKYFIHSIFELNFNNSNND